MIYDTIFTLRTLLLFMHLTYRLYHRSIAGTTINMNNSSIAAEVNEGASSSTGSSRSIGTLASAYVSRLRASRSRSGKSLRKASTAIPLPSINRKNYSPKTLLNAISIIETCRNNINNDEIRVRESIEELNRQIKELQDKKLKEEQLLKKIMDDKQFISRKLIQGSLMEIHNTVELDVKEDFLCPICKAFIVSPSILNCGHTFCTSCLDTYIKVATEEFDLLKCAVCRTRFETPATNPKLGKLLSSMAQIYEIGDVGNADGADFKPNSDNNEDSNDSDYQVDYNDISSDSDDDSLPDIS